MNSIRLGAALALALSTGAFARAKAPAGNPPDQVQCTDGTVSAKGGRGACSRHGGIARTTQSQPTQGPANRALPPTERAPDNTASHSPFSIFGGKRDKNAPAANSNAPAANSNAPAANSNAPAANSAPQGRAGPSRGPRQSSGATSAQPIAKCRDGSASYSAHHSGACSHHGGVAQWLDGR